MFHPIYWWRRYSELDNKRLACEKPIRRQSARTDETRASFHCAFSSNELSAGFLLYYEDVNAARTKVKFTEWIFMVLVIFRNFAFSFCASGFCGFPFPLASFRIGCVGQTYNYETKYKRDISLTSKSYGRQQSKISNFDSYAKRANCFSQMNGLQTQGENIADNAGIKLAYRAMMRWLRHNKIPRLPGLHHLSPEQLFFVNFAQVSALQRQ